jgi:hypothetical protein
LTAYLNEGSNHGGFSITRVCGLHKAFKNSKQRLLAPREFFEEEVGNGRGGQLKFLLHFVEEVLAIRILRSEAGAKQGGKRGLKHEAARPLQQISFFRLIKLQQQSLQIVCPEHNKVRLHPQSTAKEKGGPTSQRTHMMLIKLRWLCLASCCRDTASKDA